MSEEPIQRKVEQLNNDVTAIYDLLSQIQRNQQRHELRLNEINGQLIKHEHHFALIDTRLDRIDARLDRMDERLDRMDERFDKMDERLDKMDERFDRLEDRFSKFESGLTRALEILEAR